jgi:hypothetical protein
MARIPDDELDQLKRSTDLAALVRSKGVELKKHGAKDLCGSSPFTDEKTPSFIVTLGKNLWHCMSSGKGGSVIDFIMQYDGVSFREAVELLKLKSSSLYKSAAPVKKSTVPKLPPPVAFDPDVLSRKVSKYIKQADIGRTGSCHLFRHTCATHMLENGADIRFIQQLLGHEKLETTQIYTEVSIKQLLEVHARTHPAKLKRA